MDSQPETQSTRAGTAPMPTLRAPPRHERTSQLIRLEVAKFERQRELAEIAAACEAAAEPIALEIESLEGREAAIVAGGELASSRRDDLLRKLESQGELIARIMVERAAQDARLRGEGERIAAEVAEIDAAESVRAIDRLRVDAALSDARGRFDAARTTSTGRAIERKIAKIEQQQTQIILRNPEASYYRIEMAITKEAIESGFRDKQKAVVDVISAEGFGKELWAEIKRLRDERKSEPSELEVWYAAKGLIGRAVEAEEVDVIVSWHPPSKLHVKAGAISAAGRDKYFRAVMEKRQAAATESGPIAAPEAHRTQEAAAPAPA